MRPDLTAMPRRVRVDIGLFASLAVALLLTTLAWMIPMMLWDHLDLVPIYQAWREGGLWQSEFARVHHGSHLHVAAYAVLLLTTHLSHGQPWLDGVASWLLLLGHAALVLRLAWQAESAGAARWLPLVAILLALHPGHLANLQWGWQVAVALCLVNVTLALTCLASSQLDAWRNGLALLATCVAVASFSSGLALVPVALLLIGLRHEWSMRRRLLFALPWLLLGAMAVLWLGSGVPSDAQRDIAALALYVLNFLGGAVARFGRDLAAPLAMLALLSGLWAAWQLRAETAARAWLGLVAFGLGCALLTALGREADYGVEHAFATRYVSFSSLFWLGWVGLMALLMPRVQGGVLRLLRWGLLLIAALALFNAMHLAKQARDLAQRSQAIAEALRVGGDALDEQLLRDIYFDQPEIARQRLALLRQWGFAPFEPR